MPLRNRVDPFGQLHSDPHRGAWMGNRGLLHDGNRQIRRLQATSRWLICTLEFHGIQRTVMSPGQYTELFFLDEATALAAGHRPCNTCRRAAAQSFLSLSGSRTLGELDAKLKVERFGPRNAVEDWRCLPDGSMVFWQSQALLVLEGRLFAWSLEGYTRAETEVPDRLEVLTIPTIVQVLKAGYPVQIDSSAFKTGRS